MLETFLTAFENVLVLFIFIFAGALIRKLKIVQRDFAPQLSKVLFNFFLPCLILNVIFTSLDMEMITNNYNLIFLSIIIIIFGIVLGVVVYLPFKKNIKTPSIFIFSFTFSNFAFMGIPVMQKLYGQDVLGLLLIFSLPLYFLVGVIGYMIMASERKVDIKKIFNPSTIAMIVGFVILGLNIKMPYVALEVVSYGANVISPLAMFSVGLVIGECSVVKMFKNYKVYIISFVRLIAIPVIILIVLNAFGFTGPMLYIPVIVSAMPVATNMTILAGTLGKDVEISAQVIFVTTALSLITIPIIAGIITNF